MSNPAATSDAAGQLCPKCSAEMEPIEVGADGPPIEALQLCPSCYLVTWTDQRGPHFRQGTPVKPGFEEAPRGEPNLPGGEPEEC